MAAFGQKGDTAYELLGRSREKILSQRPVIPPPGALARPGMTPVAPATKPKFSGGPVATSVIERAVDDLLDVDGDPLLVIDDELDVAAITPEDQVIDEPPTKVLGVRADTAIVFGIGAVLVVVIAYFAGRTAHAPPKVVAPDPEPSKAPAVARETPPVTTKPQRPQVPAALDVPATEEQPAQQASREAAPVAPPKVETKEGSYEIQVVTTSEEKAAQVVKFLNEALLSPIAGMEGVQAYGKKFGAHVQVRIKGFSKDDASVLEKVQTMHDPTGGSGGFPGARYSKIKK